MSAANECEGTVWLRVRVAHYSAGLLPGLSFGCLSGIWLGPEVTLVEVDHCFLLLLQSRKEGESKAVKCLSCILVNRLTCLV